MPHPSARRLSLVALAAALSLPLAGQAESTPRTVTVSPRQLLVFGAESGEGSLLLGPGQRGFLGLDVLSLTPELLRHFGTSERHGVLVAKVAADSPAEKAGIAVGDVLVEIDGAAVGSAWDLKRVVAPRRAGDAVTIELVRDGRRSSVTAQLEEREGRVMDLGRFMSAHGDDELLVLPDAPEMRRRLERSGEQREALQRKLQVLEQRLRELEKRLDEQRR